MDDLIKRDGDRPKAGAQPPHLQLSDQSLPKIHAAMAQWGLLDVPAATLGLREEPTHISVPTSRALWLDETIEAQDNAFMPPAGSREFAHLHADGSWHIVVDKVLVERIVEQGWGEHHPWYDRGVLEVMVYAPRNEEEMVIVKKLVLESVAYASQNKITGIAV